MAKPVNERYNYTKNENGINQNHFDFLKTKTGYKLISISIADNVERYCLGLCYTPYPFY